MTTLHKEIADLSPEERELFELLLREEQLDLAQFLIPPQPRDTDVFPVSFAQQRLWILDQLEPGNPAYNLPAVIRLSGRLNVAVLGRSLNEIVRRHEALRTTFAIRDGQPVQILARALALRLPVIDLDGIPAAEREVAMRGLARAEIQRPFDLTRGPLIRTTLLRVRDGEHLLLLNMHHIVSDGWSRGVLVREIKALYRASAEGAPSPLEELPIQYVDYAVWQRQWLQGLVLERLLEYWRRALEGPLPALNLPTDRERTTTLRFPGTTELFLLPRPLLESLKALSQQEGVTLFMTLLAAFQTLLYRYTGQPDIVVGAPIAGRSRPELEGLIGFFVNTLVLRTNCAGTPRFRELLGRVREVTVGALAHEELPFERLVQALQPDRDMNRNPLFQVSFLLHTEPMPALELPELVMTPLDFFSDAAQFDLSLVTLEIEHGLRIEVEYRTDLFTSPMIARLVKHFQNLLAGIVAAPDQRLAELPLLSEPERRQLLVEWNDTIAGVRGQRSGVRSDPSDFWPLNAESQCLHQLFEAQAAHTPDAVALVFDDRDKQTTGRTTNDGSAFSVQPSAFGVHLTYHELNRRANQLARHLRTLGVGPEVLVGICAERSIELVVGLLSILKAGGAYVPLDPSYPPERLAFMLADSRAPVLLTASAERESGSTGARENFLLPFSESPALSFSTSVVDLRTAWPIIARQPAEVPASGVAPDNLAYVIYTSGSTGAPKGAMNIQRAVTNRLLWMQNAYQLTSADCVLQKTSFSFDVSVWEFFWPLIVGARLVLARPEGHKQSAYLADLIARSRITTLHFVPSMLQVFLDEQGLDRCASLRRIICSGEALPSEVQERCASRLDAELYNLYGPTEAAIDVTAWACERTSTRPVVPIGRPIANLQVYLLDPQLRPAPIGVTAELYIGGVALARGYHNRPDLTAERFVPNPFLEMNDERRTTNDERPVSSSGYRLSAIGYRLYKTGDLARYLPDGLIEYLGRIDQQVKLRGFRIELGEIEAALRQHPSVRNVAVLLREDQPGDKHLAAYVVQGSGEEDKETASPVELLPPDHRSLIPALRAFLEQRLPDYMVPAAFVLLDALPLTPNGKLDRAALPAPDRTRPALASAFVPPRTPDEELLAAIWCQVLGLDEVGIDDNFFALGGDSIRIIQALSQARERGLHFSLQQIFQHQTIRALTQEGQSARADATLVQRSQPFDLISMADRARMPDGVEDAYRLAALQAGMLFHTIYTPDSAMYHDIFSFHLRAPFDPGAFQIAVRQLVAGHAILRTSFDLANFSEPLQLIHTTAEVPVQIEDLRQLAPAAQEAALLVWREAEKGRKFDWAHAPFLRFQVHRRTDETYQFSLSFHHAILDGWSLASMLTELFQRYLSLLGGAPQSIAPPTALFRDFVALEREMLESEAARHYWLRKLSDATVAILPRWFSGGPATAAPQVRTLSITTSAEVSARLRRLARVAVVPIKSVLLAAHLRMIGLLGGTTDVLTGMVTNGRPETIDGERILGLFLNAVPFRQRLAGGTWLDLVRETFATERELLPYRRYPMAQVQRALGGQPLFETAFTFVHFHVYERLQHVPDLEVLDGDTFELTNFTLSTNFSLDLRSSLVQLSLVYDASQLCEEQVAAISRYYSRALDLMAADPARHYEQQCLLSEQEQRQLVITGNNTWLDAPGGETIYALFDAQVARTPDAVAIVYDHRLRTNDQGRTTRDALGALPAVHSPSHLTYEELDRRANQLAHHLQALGVGAEVRVAICMARSPELIVGILGIHKAGGAYLPLDPTHPQERLATLIEDSQAPILLTQQRLVDTLPTSWAMVVCLDADWELISALPTSPPVCHVTGDNLAYAIYTSGSTGSPKGVLVTHQNLVRSTQARLVYYQQPSSNFLLLMSATFDGSVAGIFWTLCQGGMLALLPDSLQRDVFQIAERIARHYSSHITIVPSLYSLLLEQASVSQLASLRLVVVAGEVCPPALVQRHFELLPQTVLSNEYGPTEGTVWSSAYNCRPNDPRADIPIGTAIPNMQIYLLDPYFQPTPIGVPGELYIGGAGLARGYRGCPDLTAERFVPNPFLEMNDERRTANDERPVSSGGYRLSAIGYRLYKTGDLARYLPDGLIEFLGRRDQQVKLRGFRIEPEEIAAALLQHPSVQSAVVMAREDMPGDMRLAAYVVPHQGSGIRRQGSDDPASGFLMPDPRSLIPDLRAFLQERLPEYMIPAVFVLLDALPLTPNGKIDRRALPPPDEVRADQAADFVAPEGLIEELLAQIWADVLGVQRVGRQDHFFELGGHSLLATQLVSRAWEVFDVELAVRDLFETPRLEGLAARLTDAQRTAAGPHAPPLRPMERAGALPLSFAQQRLWFFDQMYPNSSTYNLPATLRLFGPLDRAALVRSITAIMARHEALRTTFVTIDQPAQVIAPVQATPLWLIDLQAISENEREATALRLAREEVQRPFDLAHGPLLRIVLMQTSADAHIMVLTMHHIISDAWSIGVCISELMALYSAHVAGVPAALPALPIQYADYAIWQRQWLRGAVLEEHLAYWRAQLADLPVLELPTDYPRPNIPSFQGATLTFRLPPSLSADLAALSRREGVTLFMTLLAAWQTLLACYTGQDDIAVGTPIANRTQQATERLIGFFVNTLVLRSDLSDRPSFRILLRRVREISLGAYAHQEVPFQQVVEALQPAHDISRHPLFQVSFALQNAPLADLALPNLTVLPLAIERGSAKFDLNLALQETAAGLEGELEYRTDLFDAVTMKRLVKHCQTLLERITADIDQQTSALTLLTDAERQQLLHDWNATQAAYPQGACIHTLFADQAARTPDAIALVYETQEEGSGFILRPAPCVLHVTYAELDRHANQLAHYLQALGIGPDVCVGLCMPRTPELVIGLLGILKAGGTYVPLDPAYPQERLAFMLADAQARVLITTDQAKQPSSQAANELSGLLVAQTVIDLRADWPQIAQAPHHAPASGVTAEHLAYIIYTSGSTGTPKGVMVEHGQLVNTLCASQAIYHFTTLDRVPHLLSFAFDISLFQLFSPLLVGGAALLVSAPQLLEKAQVVQLLGQSTFLHATPSLLRYIVDCAQVGATSHSYLQLRQVAVGGDAVPPALLADFQTTFTAARVNVGYGPTEGTIMCMNYAVPQGAIPQQRLIGRPMRNMFVRLYDRDRKLVPIGVPGELYIGGVCVTRGYLHNDELTRDKFVQIDEQRWYRTGDRARYRADGNIEFLGRIDQQVKLRGYRIEPGEIAAVLGRHPAVRESVVVLREDAAGEKRLVAYIVMTNDERRTTNDQENDSSIVRRPSSVVSELRAFLAERLPAYMLPAAFVQLDALPLTPNGKLDRQALPLPMIDRRELDAAYVAPRTETEAVLAAIWAEALGLERVGVNDHFFDLGGHSLLVFQVISQVRRAMHLRVPMNSLQTFRTIARLAEYIELLRWARHDANTAHEDPQAIREGRELTVAQDERGTPIVEHSTIIDFLSYIRSLNVKLWAEDHTLHYSAPPGTISPTLQAELIARNADILAFLDEAAAAQLSTRADQGVITGQVPLTPVQRKFFAQRPPAPHHWNIATLVELESVRAALVRRALRQVLKHHDGLRLRFVHTDAGWRSRIADLDDDIPFSRVNLAALAADARRAAFAAVARAQQSSLNLAEGPLLRVVLVEYEQPPAQLLVIANHLVCDGFSMRIVLQDLAQAYQQLAAGEPVRLPPKTTSFKEWTEQLVAYAQSAELRRELRYWQTTLQAPIARLPVDRPGGTLTEANARLVRVSLTHEETARLNERLRTHETTITEVLLTALMLAFAGWTGEPAWLIELVNHGRETIFEEIDLSRTVGWLVSHVPVRLYVDTTRSAAVNLQQVKAQLRQIPNRGFGFAVLRYLAEDVELADALAALPQAQVIFNFLGHADGAGDDSTLFAGQPELGPTGAHKNVPSFLLIFNGILFDNRLHLSLTYSDATHDQRVIAALGRRVLAALRELLAALPLPPPDQRPDAAGTRVAPRTPLETVLVRMWMQILGVTQMGVHDNFFDLGGHSLLATQIVARVADAFQVDVPLRTLLEAPTVAGLAAAVLQYSGRPARVEKTAQLLIKLAALSEEEVSAILTERGAAPREEGSR
jgi:amino acid adenylation domain-containing protein/non-ribosomal peptide synthase protein (TIGR01720 family)